MSQFNKRNLSMVLDLYEMTMSNGLFLDNRLNDRVIFDVFYRKNPDNGGFAVLAGIEQIIDYILNFHFDSDDIKYLESLNLFDSKFLDFLSEYKFMGDVYSFKEGTIIYPNEPIITVEARMIDAQIIETGILNIINHQSLIATKAQRLVFAAKNRIVSDFGARRAHNMDSAIYGARAAYIGGVSSTSNLFAGKLFNIPVTGTMAHSFIMFYKDEYQAFKQYAITYPDHTVLLIDTYDVINSGVKNAIRVSKEVLEPMGKRLKGVRIDSGDLAYLSKKVRKILDENGLIDCQIVVTNSLDEYTISSLINQHAEVDIFGVGERLITAKSDAVFGAVYKIAAVCENGSFSPRIKLSDSVEKITNPGKKKVYRIYNNHGFAVADLIVLDNEEVNLDEKYQYVDPIKPWEKRFFEDCTKRELQECYIKNGKLVRELESIEEIRKYVSYQLSNEIWKEEQRFDNPHQHYIDMSMNYYQMKISLMNQSKTEV